MSRKFLLRMEFHKSATCRFRGKTLSPSLQDENRLDEILPQFGIVEPTVLFYRKQGKVFMNARANMPIPDWRACLGRSIPSPVPYAAG